MKGFLLVLVVLFSSFVCLGNWTVVLKSDRGEKKRLRSPILFVTYLEIISGVWDLRSIK